MTVACHCCGEDTSEWSSVLWHNEENRDGQAKVILSHPLAFVCPLCAPFLMDDVFDAVRAAVDDQHDRCWPGARDDAVVDLPLASVEGA